MAIVVFIHVYTPDKTQQNLSKNEAAQIFPVINV